MTAEPRQKCLKTPVPAAEAAIGRLAAAENREKPEAVYGSVIRQERRGSLLDCGRPLHGGLGSCGDDSTGAPLR
jgi:hypothetical protein